MNSINKDTSWLRFTDASGWPSSDIDYDNAVLIVEGNKLTFEAELYINDAFETHVITYEGEYSLIDMTSIY